MANLQGINSEMSGKVGKFVYRQRNGKTIVTQAPRKYEVPRRSDKQMYVRCQIGNIAANYRLYTGRLALGFEDKVGGQSEFNLMVQANYGFNPVFITKYERLNGGCVLAPYTFTRGTLPSIGYSLSDGVLVSELALGSLTISASSTVADLAMAILANNSGWEDGDQLTFFYGVQTVDAITSVPRAAMNSWKVVLNTSNENLLSTVASTLGFTTVNGHLGMSTALSNAGAAWVHSRNNSDGTLLVGTQNLYVVNSLLASYQSSAAFNAAADSYGGVNTKSVYLSPQTSVDVLTEMAASQANPAAAEFIAEYGSSANQNENGGNTGGSSTGTETGGGNTGGNTGGSSTGSDTTGTPVLTISKTGSGTATVSAGGNEVNSGDQVAAETQVSLSVTPATGQTPSATLNGTSVTLTESDGTYTGSFSMPSSNATLVINTGNSGGIGDTN